MRTAAAARRVDARTAGNSAQAEPDGTVSGAADIIGGAGNQRRGKRAGGFQHDGIIGGKRICTNQHAGTGVGDRGYGRRGADITPGKIRVAQPVEAIDRTGKGDHRSIGFQRIECAPARCGKRARVGRKSGERSIAVAAWDHVQDVSGGLPFIVADVRAIVAGGKKRHDSDVQLSGGCFAAVQVAAGAGRAVHRSGKAA